MLLTGLQLTNFKCFEDSGHIPLSPLTVIFGRNNTGKSSILQALLLLRQTLDSPQGEPRLNLSGRMYDAGTYRDIAHQHRMQQDIGISLSVEASERTHPKLDTFFSLWRPEGSARTNGHIAGRVDLEFSSDDPRPPRIVRLSVVSQGVMPVEVRRGRGAGGPYELTIGDRVAGNQRAGNFFFAADSPLPLIGPEPPRRGRPDVERPSRNTARYMANATLRSLEGALLRLRAVGAFRQQPERKYSYKGHVPDVLDLAGENVVNAVIEDITRRRAHGELLAQVNAWLARVGHVRLLPPRRVSKAARDYEIRVRDMRSGQWAQFADVGFGIGQALPVIVEGLRTPSGGTFMAQEPEIHLHPDAQLAMADFLISLVRSGRRVIVETHSEYMLLRFRRAVVEAGRRRFAGGGLSHQEITIVYVDKHDDGTSTTRTLALDELAQVTNWPKGFMGEASDERMALLEAMARRAETGR